MRDGIDSVIETRRAALQPNEDGIIPRNQIREMVNAILTATKMNNRPIDAVKLAKKLGFAVLNSSLCHIDDGDVIGMMYAGDEAYEISPGIKEKRFIALEENDSHARKRSTIAHEIGHFALEGGGFSKRSITSDKNDSKEQNASRFMYELLMPYDLLVAELSRIRGMSWKKVLNEVSECLDISFGILKRHIETISERPVLEQNICPGRCI